MLLIATHLQLMLSRPGYPGVVMVVVIHAAAGFTTAPCPDFLVSCNDGYFKYVHVVMRQLEQQNSRMEGNGRQGRQKKMERCGKLCKDDLEQTNS